MTSEKVDPESPARSSAERTLFGNGNPSVDRRLVNSQTLDSEPKRRASYEVFDHRPSHIWFQRRSSVGRSPRRPSIVLQHPKPGKKWWTFKLRDWDEGDDQDWWFASTAIPLLCATIGPLANVFSIAALVVYWRMCLVSGVDKSGAVQCLWDGDSSVLTNDLGGVPYADPHWCYALNAASLALGFIGNFFLLCNFTNRIRYIVALPATILMWYAATAILAGIVITMHVYVPPAHPQETYTQGFWYAVLACCMYMVCSMLLMVNMLGYFLGHYPSHFALTDSQRTLILQTMMFFFWLAAGAAVFNHVENEFGTEEQNWNYVNALYFCDVTILTVGFGDLYPGNNVSRGLVFPYSVGGIIMLGLTVSSITKFATEIGSQNVIQRHIEHSRARTIGRTVTRSLDLEDRPTIQEGERPVISFPFPNSPTSAGDHSRTTNFNTDGDNHPAPPRRAGTFANLRRAASRRSRKPKLILLREEKDRFDAMRHIQHDTARFKRWSSLTMSIIMFAIIWAVGAVVFWQCEKNIQGMTYFEALYFCYVSLLTIGYGDLAPRSNGGRPFFVFWSLIAVPTMAILVNDLGDTVINKFKHGTFRLADFTVLPKHGAWREFLESHPWLLNWLQSRKERREADRRRQEGLPVGPEPLPVVAPTIDELATDEPSNEDLARRLPDAIRRAIIDVKSDTKKFYTYEEWVEFTQLIRFTAKTEEDRETDNAEDGLIEWDWIGEDSPMMSTASEAEFVLERLCESLSRWIKRSTTPAQTDRQEGEGNSSFKHLPEQRKSTPDNGSGGDSLRRSQGGTDTPRSDNLGPYDENAMSPENNAG